MKASARDDVGSGRAFGVRGTPGTVWSVLGRLWGGAGVVVLLQACTFETSGADCLLRRHQYRCVDVVDSGPDDAGEPDVRVRFAPYSLDAAAE